MMRLDLFGAVSPFLSAVDPEISHRMAIRGLRAGLYPRLANDQYPVLQQRLWGLSFPNPLGMAAGFDKNGEVSSPLLALGFGFTEVGTVTPEPQAGNPRPRIFRIGEAEAVINRLGFNNDGHDVVLSRLNQFYNPGVIGVNIGANKYSSSFIDDYVRGIEKFSEVASYFTVNISSPNTVGLRDLQHNAALEKLIAALLSARERNSSKRPILLKIAPDVEEQQLYDICRLSLDAQLDGIIVSNTTVSRPIVGALPHAEEAGGLSGRPLFALSTRRLAQAYRYTEAKIPLIGVGGVNSAEAAFTKILAGASLVQLYTGLIYHGPLLVRDILRGLVDRLDRHRYANIRDAVGRGAEKIAAGTGLAGE